MKVIQSFIIKEDYYVLNHMLHKGEVYNVVNRDFSTLRIHCLHSKHECLIPSYLLDSIIKENIVIPISYLEE